MWGVAPGTSCELPDVRCQAKLHRVEVALSNADLVWREAVEQLRLSHPFPSRYVSLPENAPARTLPCMRHASIGMVFSVSRPVASA